MKVSIPNSREEKGVLAKKLMKYNVSLLEYAQALQQEEIRYRKFHYVNVYGHKIPLCLVKIT